MLSHDMMWKDKSEQEVNVLFSNQSSPFIRTEPSWPDHLPLNTINLECIQKKENILVPAKYDGMDTQEQAPSFFHREVLQWLALCC